MESAGEGGLHGAAIGRPHYRFVRRAPPLDGGTAASGGGRPGSKVAWGWARGCQKLDPQATIKKMPINVSIAEPGIKPGLGPSLF